MKIIEKIYNSGNNQLYSWNYKEIIIIDAIKYIRYNTIDKDFNIMKGLWHTNESIDIDENLEKMYKQHIRSQKLNNILNENY
jgi:hypothetical protein